MKLELQVEDLYRQLDEELMHFPSGSRFYSVRQIMTRFQCHRGVIDATLERLETDGLIQRVPQVGIFSRVNRKPLARKVLYAAPDWPGEISQEWSRLASQYAEKHSGWQLRKILYDPERDTMCSLAVGDADALILTRSAREISPAEMVWLGSLTIPVVLLNTVGGSFAVSTVNSNDEVGAMMAGNYLVARGHRAILAVQAEFGSSLMDSRVSAFAMACRLRGATVKIVDCHTRPAEYSRQRAYQGMKEFLAAESEPFSACYVTSGESVPGVMAALREQGLEIPDEVSVIGHASIQEGEFLHPPLTAVCADLHAEVSAAFEGLQACLEQQIPCFKSCIPMKLIERASVRDL